MRRARVLTLLLFLSLVSSSTSAQEFSQSEAQNLLRQASKLVPEIPDQQQASVGSNIASAQARAGDLPDAISTIQALKPKDRARTLNTLAHFLDHSNALEEALRIVEAMPEGQIRDNACEAIARVHADQKDFSTALRIAHLIHKDPTRLSDSLSRIAQAEWKSGDHSGAEKLWDEATEVAKQAGKNDPDPVALLMAIVISRAQVGQTAEASAGLNDLARILEQRGQGASALASAFTQIGDINSALEIIRAMPPGMDRDIFLMQVSQEFIRQNDVADAEKIASGVADPQIKTMAFSHLALTEADAGRPASAVDKAGDAPNAAGRIEILATLAFEQAQKGDAAASASLQLATAAANENPATTPVFVFEQIAVANAILGNLDVAEATVRRLSADHRWWAWQSITGMLADSGNLEAALRIATEETDAYPKACALLGTADGILSYLHRKIEQSQANRDQER